MKLTPMERKALRAFAGCGCCGTPDELMGLFPELDTCPVDEDGWVEHHFGYAEGSCIHDADIADIIDHISAPREPA